jgi:hypothetical protein
MIRNEPKNIVYIQYVRFARITLGHWKTKCLLYEYKFSLGSCQEAFAS